ncbi:hypothetical protein IAR50_000715 [Cryptococcus sp. DSM 104548]
MKSPNSDMAMAHAFYARIAAQAESRQEQQRDDCYSKASAQAELWKTQQQRPTQTEDTTKPVKPATSFKRPDTPSPYVEDIAVNLYNRAPDTRPSYCSRRSAEALARLKQLGYDPANGQCHVYPPPGWIEIPKKNDRRGAPSQKDIVGYFPLGETAGVPLERERASKGRKREEEDQCEQSRVGGEWGVDVGGQ